MSLQTCYSIADLRRKAKSRIPAAMFHYIDGGADDEWSLRNNAQAFARWELLPGYLRDISDIDLRHRVLDTQMDLPFFLSPTGMSRLFHHEKELAVARAAAGFGTMYSLSTLATTSLEDVAAETEGPKMFQIYILKDRELTREFVQRCKAAGYKAMCLTVDTLVAGNREREKKYGMSIPPTINRHNFWSYATRWHWLFHFLRDPNFQLANVAHRQDALGSGTMALIDYVNSQFDRSLTWDDAAWLVQQWDGPFLIKGMSTPADAEMAVQIGASGAMLSNHGGRQLNFAPAPVDCIAPIRDAVGDKLELIVDGGIRRGTDILKAYALGADGCSVGRAYLYGLAAGGQAGVERALTLLKEEIERDLALLGVRSVAGLTADHLQRCDAERRAHP